MIIPVHISERVSALDQLRNCVHSFWDLLLLNPCAIESKIRQSELGIGGSEEDEDNLDEEIEVKREE